MQHRLQGYGLSQGTTMKSSDLLEEIIRIVCYIQIALYTFFLLLIVGVIYGILVWVDVLPALWGIL